MVHSNVDNFSFIVVSMVIKKTFLNISKVLIFSSTAFHCQLVENCAPLLCVREIFHFLGVWHTPWNYMPWQYSRIPLQCLSYRHISVYLLTNPLFLQLGPDMKNFCDITHEDPVS